MRWPGVWCSVASPTTRPGPGARSPRRACRASWPIDSPMAFDRSGWLRVLASTAMPLLLGGWGLALAYPRVDFHALAWLGLVPMFGAVMLAGPRAAFGWGWFTGTVFFL